MQVEPSKNGQVDQRRRRRPGSAVASTRTTPGFFHSQAFGLKGSQNSPKNRGSSLRPPNSDHNGTNSPNSSTARPGKSRAATAGHLPALIRPLPKRHVPVRRNPKVLDHYPAVVEFVFNH